MSRFAVHLWKEWRTHRLALLVTLLGFPMALATVVTLSGAKYARDWSFALVVAACGIAAMLVAVGGELLAERGERGVTWLERVPRSLGSAFAAKLALLLLSSLAAVAASLGILAVLEGIRDVELTSKPLDWIRALFLFLPLVVWTFALSAWALRGGLAFVTALFLIGLVVGPGVALATQGFQAISQPATWGLTTLTSTGLLAAWLAFVPRWMRGVGRGRVLAVVVAPALVLVPPTWMWAARRWEERTHFEPGQWTVLLERATEDGRHVVMVVRPLARGWDWDVLEDSVVRIDLATREWETIGGRGATASLRRLEGELVPSTLVVSGPGGRVWLDPADGSPVEPTPDAELADVWPSGLGWRSLEVEDGIFDLTRGRSFPRDVLWRGVQRTLVLPGRWLVHDDDDEDWYWLDPDTRRSEPTGWKAAHLDPEAVLADGRVVLRELNWAADRCALHLLDPRTEQSVEIWRGPTDRPPLAAGLAGSFVPQERPVFLVGSRLLVFDADGALRERATLPSALWRMAGWAGANALLFVDGQGGRVLHVDLDTKACEVVLP